MKGFKKKPKSERSRGKKDLSKHYFTIVHEQAIIDYNSSPNPFHREKLFRNIIQPVFSEMVDKIIRTFRFNQLQNISLLAEECKTWLPSVLCKFNPEKSKAFSYFSVIIKHWFMAEQKKQKTQQKKETQIIDLDEFIDYNDPNLIYYNTMLEDAEERQFFAKLQTDLRKWGDILPEIGAFKVANAIADIMDEIDDVDVFNKKTLYFYLREMTQLPNKEIAEAVKALKEEYQGMRKRWENKIFYQKIY